MEEFFDSHDNIPLNCWISNLSYF